jgi:hypothetical protein
MVHHTYMDENGYNMNFGGDSSYGYKHTVEQKEKWSKDRKGKTLGTENPFFEHKHSDEQKQKWREMRLGIKQSEETKKKRSKSHMGLQVGEKNGMYNKHHSAEQKQKWHEERSAKWLITDPEGNEFIINDMQQFCIENNLRRASMYRVGYGYRKSHKKYKCQKINC